MRQGSTDLTGCLRCVLRVKVDRIPEQVLLSSLTFVVRFHSQQRSSRIACVDQQRTLVYVRSGMDEPGHLGKGLASN